MTPEPLSPAATRCPAGCGHPLTARSTGLGCSYRDCDCTHGRPRQHPIPLGVVHITPGALDVLATARVEQSTLLDRHRRGDWGDVDADEAEDNNRAAGTGSLIHSIYDLGTGASVWVITEGDRSTTIVITPDEY